MDTRARFLTPIAAAFCVALVVSNVIAGKVVDLGVLEVSGASLIFPLTYWIDDALTEVYGYAVARRVVWLGVVLQLAAFGAIALTLALPGAIPPQAAAFNAALALTGWIVAGSLTAIAVGQFANAYVLARMKVWTETRWLFSRAWASTLIGQALDSVVFVFIAFGIGSRATGHAIPWAQVWHIAWSIWVVKCAVEIGLTPVTYAVVTALKRFEGLDAYDYDTDFNPLAVLS